MGIIDKEIAEELREKALGVSALVLITVVAGTPRELSAGIAGLPGVEKVYELTGDIDLVALVSAVDMDELSTIIFEIRRVRGVVRTDTRTIIGVSP